LNTKRIAILGMLCAMAYMLVFIAHLVPIKLVPSVSFLSYDPKDIAIAISGFLLGPMAALIITIVVSVLELLTISTTGWIGLIMNILSTLAFACPAAIIYRRWRTSRGALFGLICSVLFMTGVMMLWNVLITPLYMGVDRAVVVGMLIPGFLPFNLLKGSINAGITLLLYKPVSKALRSVTKQSEEAESAKSNFPLWIVGSGILIITITLVLLVYTGVI
jgi:riboflavin transporter FmnP